MAERRMFSKSIVLSDAFLDMPLSARCLYFTLGMLADDDGFVGNPKSIMRQCGASQDDMSVLLQKRYVLGFESGVIVIKHWRMNNYLQNDRHKSTTYIEELNTLKIDEKGAYTEKQKNNVYSMYTDCIQSVYTDKNSIDKNSIDKNSIEENIDANASPAPQKESKHRLGDYQHVLLTDTEREKLVDEYGLKLTDEAIKYLDEYIEMKGYKAKSHYLCIKKRVIDAVKEQQAKRSTNKTAQNLDEFYDMAASWAESEVSSEKDSN